jgi:succinate dehydrogenase hydrophobic anchor subunit
MPENNKTDIENILNKIKSDEVKMTSKQFFLMKWLTLMVTSVFFLFLAFYIFAYVTFLFIDNGLMSIPLSAQGGLFEFLVEIPWTLVVLGLVSIFLFSITSKTFYKIYRKPFLTFFFLILIIIMISHIIFVESGIMRYVKQEAYEMHVQLVPTKFLDFRDSQTGTLFVGYVVSTTSNSVIIRDRRNALEEVFVAEGINLNDLLVGALINAYGIKVDGKVQAKSIEIVE